MMIDDSFEVATRTFGVFNVEPSIIGSELPRPVTPFGQSFSFETTKMKSDQEYPRSVLSESPPVSPPRVFDCDRTSDPVRGTYISVF